MPRRSREPEPKKSDNSHRRASTSPSSSSFSTSPSGSRPRSKRKRSTSNDRKKGQKAKPKDVKKERKPKASKSPKREEKRAKSRSKSPKREGREKARSRSREGKDRRNTQERNKPKPEPREKPKKRELSPLVPGGRRWDDSSVKKESELGGWGGEGGKDKGPKAAPTEKLKPDFTTSGVLEEERHTVNGINLNYSEPPDARNPDAKWRLYVFKGEKQMDPLAIHRQSAYIVGRERKVAHLPIDHPSCSKQHSVIQFRIKRVAPATADEEAVMAIRPYIIDLNSTNGTMLNGKRIDPAKYYELLEEDVLKFGHSTREYVLIKAETQAGPTTLD